jgi:Peptidase MA superfamily
VNKFYGQSWSTVKYLIDTYGQPKYAQLFRTIYSGSRIDDALRQVYSLDQDSLYNAWRQKNGLQPVAVSQQEVVTAPQATGTRPPLGLPSTGGVITGETAVAGSAGTASTASTANAAGSNRVMGILVLVGAIIFAGALGGGGFLLMRSRGR